MPPKTKEQEAFEKLPQNIKDILLSLDTSKSLRDIARENKITDIKRIGGMSNLMTQVTLGFLPRNQLVNELIKKLGMDEGVAVGVEQGIQREIFSKMGGIVKEEKPIQTEAPVQGVQIEREIPSEEIEGTRDVSAAITLNKDTLLREIEHPALISAHSGTGTIIDDKLGGVVKIPREEVRINLNNIPKTITTKPYTSTDPYREPIE